MAKLDMQILTRDIKVIGQDGLVELKLLQSGIIIGTWKVIVLIIISLHFSTETRDGHFLYLRITYLTG